MAKSPNGSSASLRAQDLLVDKGEAPDIVRAFDLVRLHVSRVETGAVIRRILLTVDQVFLQQTQFQDTSPDAGLRFKRLVPVFWITGQPVTLDCAWGKPAVRLVLIDDLAGQITGEHCHA